MSIALELTVDAEDPGSYELHVVGEIYVAGTEEESPIVTHVIASPLRSTRFTLDPGRYELRFHIERAGGRFKITLRRRGLPPVLVKDAGFDTAVGFEHRVFKFEVA